MEKWCELLPSELHLKYEFHNFNHAIEIMHQAYDNEFLELISALRTFSLTVSDITTPGGSESPVPKKFSKIIAPMGWQEIQISGDLLVKVRLRNSKSIVEHIIHGYLDGHNIDYVKNRIAVDFEWNSKDQTFDRDLYAFRTLYECDIISCGVIVTRSEEMNRIFQHYSLMKKYGASTTWMGKLLPRLNSRRHGGCPLFVVGITPKVVSDWEENRDKQ